MRTVLCLVLLSIGTLVPGTASGQQCLKWDAFCDGIQIDAISGCSNIIAQWYSYDCAGSNTPMTGGKVGIDAPNLCGGGNGAAAIVCDLDDCGALFGSGWTFTIDSLDGTLDMNQGFPPVACWIDELAYTKTAGVCTGGPGGEIGGVPENLPSWRGSDPTGQAARESANLVPDETVAALGEAACDACPGDQGPCYCIVTDGVVDGCGGGTHCPEGQTCKLGDYVEPFDGNDGCRCG